MTRRRLALAGLLIGALLGVLLWALGREEPARIVRGPLKIEERSLLPPGTPTPANWRAGIVVVRDSADYAVSTPRPGQVGTHYELRPDTVGATPNWAPAETAIAKAASKGLSTWLSVNIYDNGRGATPDAPHLLPNMPTVTWADGCGNTEVAPDYRALPTPYAAFVQGVTDAFNSNPNVAGYVFGAGVAEEAINTYQMGGDCASKRSNFEKVVSCEQFIAWVKTGAQIWAERTDKPVTLAAGAAACIGDYAASMERTNERLFGSFYPPTPLPGAAPQPGVTPTPMYGIQYRSNGLRAAGADQWNWQSGWGKFQTGQRLAELGGAAFEFGTLGTSRPAGCSDGFPCAIPTADRVGYTSDAAWQAMSNGAANLFWQCHPTQGCWLDYLSSDARYAITKTMGTDWTSAPAVWIRFADAINGRVNNRSDQPGPWGFLARVSGTTQPTRLCAPSVYATVTAAGPSSYATPAVCQGALSTPVAPESRYAFQYAAQTTVGIDVDDRWTGKESSAFTVKLVYLDSGTDTFRLRWYIDPEGTTERVRTITKTGTNTWQTYSLNSAAYFDNLYPASGGLGVHDLEIETQAGAETLYLLWLENRGTVTGPTATATWTPGPTPSVTPGATATGAPAAIASAAEIGQVESVTLYRSAPNTTHAGAEHEYAASDGQSAASTVLLRWPELRLPANSWVVSATLTLAGAAPAPAVARLREVGRAVDLGAATWASSGVQPWAAGGALGAGDTRAEGLITFALPAQWYSYTFRVDDTVRRWLEQGADNAGWLIDVTQTQGGLPLQAEIGGAGQPLAQYRPTLTVYLGFAVTPTATPTRTQTPTVLPTGTVAPTATGTVTATPTPAAGLWLSEACLNPATDLNLDGAVNVSDRAVELVNWQGSVQDLTGWRLIFETSGKVTNCQATEPQVTFTLPRLASVSAYGRKVIYGRDLRNLLGAAFTMPGGSTKVILHLCNPQGVERDTAQVPPLSAGSCVARSGATWVKTGIPTLGK